MPFQETLQIALISAGVGAILSLVGQAIVILWLNRKFEEFKGGLQTKLFEHQTKFSSYYQNKTEVIRELYAGILEYCDDVIVQTMGHNALHKDIHIPYDQRREQFKELFRKERDVYAVLKKNFIYIEEPLYSRVMNNLGELSQAVGEYHWAVEKMYHPDDKDLNIDQVVELQNRAGRFAYQAYTTAFELRPGLGKEFRQELSGLQQ